MTSLPQPRCAEACCSGRSDRYPPPAYGRWCTDARDDPITGLIAWPGFYRRLPDLLRASMLTGRHVGLAIGDVDDLKHYVENTKTSDPQTFGHLAGNALMGRLGAVSRNWLLTRVDPAFGRHACVATFGGDEIIIAGETDGRDVFSNEIRHLRDTLCSILPRTVSFAVTTLDPNSLPRQIVGEHWWTEYTVHAIGAVERALFKAKWQRKESADIARTGGVVETADPPAPPDQKA